MGELNVKVGDKVLYCGGYSYNHFEKIATVTRVTPTGRIRISCTDTQFDKYGNEMGNRDRWSAPCYIKELTDEDIKRVSENEIISKCLNMVSKLNAKNLSFAKASSIISILESED